MGKVLVTGGAGYIGSHAAVALIESGREIVVVDNLSNSKSESIERVKRITGTDFPFIVGDVCDYALMSRIFADYTVDCVIHFAGLKAVGESVQVPLRYYENNLLSSINLLKVMAEYGCKKIIFSSSATVYGVPERLPLTEDMPTSAVNPYGATKLFIERIISDYAYSDKAFSAVNLRYFNPVGAHKSGLIGEDPQGIPNNLMPYIAKVASGELPYLKVYGGDYPTADGTGRRDYIHITDLAKGHVFALAALKKPGCHVYNLGTGTSFSVLEMAAAFEAASGRKVRYEIVDRREGDVAECYAACDKAARELNWRAELGLTQMCEDLWRWQSQNPRGYDK